MTSLHGVYGGDVIPVIDEFSGLRSRCLQSNDAAALSRDFQSLSEPPRLSGPAVKHRGISPLDRSKTTRTVHAGPWSPLSSRCVDIFVLSCGSRSGPRDVTRPASSPDLGMDDEGDDDPVPLPNVNAAILKKVEPGDA
ncbi:S-phase kinase-associated protein 1 [Liparis tanakae]|uniref:S-phase kinase-associated protein 1 n=1 Tax=Liparis tanakae TaxID=230148 RepID=A0A4Z2F0H6_9TELE|nr:S-phase kinase-associated protein 1 [Liparis tanakae]